MLCCGRGAGEQGFREYVRSNYVCIDVDCKVRLVLDKLVEYVGKRDIAGVKRIMEEILNKQVEEYKRKHEVLPF